MIRLWLVFVIIMCVLMMAFGGISALHGNSTISIGVNGMTESRCIEGYKFVIGEQGQPRQILDEFGKGVRCETTKKPGGF